LHWHIAENGYCADTFFSLPKVFKLSDFEFFDQFNKHLPESLNDWYSNIWSKYSESQYNGSRILDSNDFNEFNLMSKVLKAMPRELLNLNISNSMGVRLAAYNLAFFSPNWNVYSNRGVSGIDGCSSTALGIALIDPVQNYFITGDLAFLYDINAFLVNEMPKNLKVVIMNNDGGGIFRNIEGPSKMQESNPFVYTPHQLNAKHLASHYKVRYIGAENQEQFEVGLNEFIQYQGICFFEVFSDSNHNTQFFNQYKQIQI
jgi:2-succinyl-5-enolpyruvyl-6-hydroxy-3-cyclohexene-1-carboxylate synthase